MTDNQLHQYNNGFREITMDSWREFQDYVSNDILDFNQHILWRGQKDSSWPLEPSLVRLYKRQAFIKYNSFKQEQLENFKSSCIGRRGLNPRDLTENEWWALGQHYGLATPLLDWSRSPFIAAFFAFAESNQEAADRSAIFGLDKVFVDIFSENKQAWSPIIEIYEPQLNENSRLISQSGLFTISHNDQNIQNWLSNYLPSNFKAPVLTKITLPNSERNKTIKSLNRMNINYMTLFPDLFGACQHSNLCSQINCYK